MPTVLMTAFEPYDRWQENSSWLTLIDLTRDLPAEPKLVTRRYPVDFQKARKRLEADLAANYDFAIHLGQAPGSTRIRLEAIGLNVGGASDEFPEGHRPLTEDGPVAYRTSLPLSDWSARLRSLGIPAQVSYHAGTYLCNAVLYLSHYLAERRGLSTRSAFIHLPLAPEQVLAERFETPSLPISLSSAALRVILAQLAAST